VAERLSHNIDITIGLDFVTHEEFPFIYGAAGFGRLAVLRSYPGGRGSGYTRARTFAFPPPHHAGYNRGHEQAGRFHSSPTIIGSIDIQISVGG
jgi:hypothetical protein